MAGLLAKHRFVLVATWEDFCGNARQTSVWNGSNWGFFFAVMLANTLFGMVATGDFFSKHRLALGLVARDL